MLNIFLLKIPSCMFFFPDWTPINVIGKNKSYCVYIYIYIYKILLHTFIFTYIIIYIFILLYTYSIEKLLVVITINKWHTCHSKSIAFHVSTLTIWNYNTKKKLPKYVSMNISYTKLIMSLLGLKPIKD